MTASPAVVVMVLVVVCVDKHYAPTGRQSVVPGSYSIEIVGQISVTKRW